MLSLILNNGNQDNHYLIADTKMMEYRPSVVALSALCCCLDKFHSTATCIAPHSSLSRFFNQDQKVFFVNIELQIISTCTRLYIYSVNSTFHFSDSIHYIFLEINNNLKK